MFHIVYDISNIKQGDHIRGTNFTNSQKYIDMPGYSDYNSSRQGVVVSSNHKTKYDIIIQTVNGETMSAVRNPGSSGDAYIELS